MMSTTNVSTTSDAGPTQNKLQRPSEGNQAEDSLSATGRKPNEVDNDPNKSDQTNKSGKRSRDSVGTTAPEAKRTNNSQDYGRDSLPRFLVVESLQTGKTMTNVSPFVIAKTLMGSAVTVKS